MSDFIKRVETKYLIPSSVFDGFIKTVSPNISPDRHFHQRIHNVYYDNETNDIVRLSLTKPNFKEKLRLRAYESLENPTNKVGGVFRF
jgi:SPX domain protein involved in polyphosphate accumulation